MTLDPEVFVRLRGKIPSTPIWNMVSFLQRLPELSTRQYQVLTARSDSTKERVH